MSTLFGLGETAQSYFQRVSFIKSLVKTQLAWPRYWYEMLQSYYENNGLYDSVQGELYEQAIWTPGMKSLRNPVNRAVEFHVSKLWPGPLTKAFPLIAENNKVLTAVEKIWTWSNWGVNKQLMARHLAGLGDAFIKVAVKIEAGAVTRVYLDLIRPMNVTALDLDERGFITFIRMDVPAGEQVHTEVWSKASGGVRVWKHDRGLDVELESLGSPTQQTNFDDLGFDFIPVIHAKFRDIGQPRGVACFVHALDKIDEANRQATRLHQILFRYNKPTIAVLANNEDSSGRPLPPPTILGAGGSSSATNDEIQLKDDEIWSMPGKSSVEYLVPNLNYADALGILNAQMQEIAQDLPEVLYYELQNKTDLSGVALRTLLGPAIDRVIEARGNAEPSLIRSHEMALTIAKLHGLLDEDIGSYEAGDFTHTFGERDVIPTSSTERAETIQKETSAGVPLPSAMKHNGYSEEEVQTLQNSYEYKLLLLTKLMEMVKTAGEANIPIETVLRQAGWTNEMLTLMGTQRLAAIALEQEDTIPDIQQ